MKLALRFRQNVHDFNERLKLREKYLEDKVTHANEEMVRKDAELKHFQALVTEDQYNFLRLEEKIAE